MTDQATSSRALPLTLALSGGGAKCAAQAGVLAVLGEARLPVGAVAGLSGGAVVGVLHALGWPPEAIRDYLADTHLLEVWEFDPTRRALFGAHKIQARLHKAVGEKTFRDLKIPVTVLSTDMQSGRLVHLNSGRLEDALRATMALPGLFSPLLTDGMTLVDGGILNPLPVDVARAMGPRVVAVDVVHDRAVGEPTQIFEVRGPMGFASAAGRRLGLTEIVESVYQAASLMSGRLSGFYLQRSPPDVLMQPAVGRIGLFAFDMVPEAYEAGVASGTRALPELRALAHPSLAARLGQAWRRAFIRRT